MYMQKKNQYVCQTGTSNSSQPMCMHGGRRDLWVQVLSPSRHVGSSIVNAPVGSSTLNGSLGSLAVNGPVDSSTVSAPVGSSTVAPSSTIKPH